MFNIFLVILIPLIIYFINSLIIRKKFIPNFSGNIHQRFLNNKNVPLSGGIFLSVVLIYIFFNDPTFLKVTIFLIFLIGFFSDINFLTSVKWRFLFQSLTIFFFIYFSDNIVQSIRIDFLDVYLQNFWISLLFTSFCLMILINGTNFIDGLNGLIISYFSIILYILFILGWTELFFPSNLNYVILLLTVVTLILLNFSNKLYMGDSGSYVIGFLMGYILIVIYTKFPLISPYFVALLLWYPAFEILFSIVRKLKTKKSPIEPDNSHLHHLLFFFIEKKFSFKKNTCNNVTSIFIITYNFIIFNISLIDIYFTYYHVFLILLNVSIYLLIYLKLLKYKKLKS